MSTTRPDRISAVTSDSVGWKPSWNGTRASRSGAPRARSRVRGSRAPIAAAVVLGRLRRERDRRRLIAGSGGRRGTGSEGSCREHADGGPGRAAPPKICGQSSAALTRCGQPLSARRIWAAIRATVVGMAEPEDEANGPGADGMGSTPHGPSFLPWSPAPTPQPNREPIPPHPIPGRPSPSRLPTLISVLAIGLVAMVVVAASLIAFVADNRVAGVPRVPAGGPAQRDHPGRPHRLHQQ